MFDECDNEVEVLGGTLKGKNGSLEWRWTRNTNGRIGVRAADGLANCVKGWETDEVGVSVGSNEDGKI